MTGREEDDLVNILSAHNCVLEDSRGSGQVLHPDPLSVPVHTHKAAGELVPFTRGHLRSPKHVSL